MTSDPFEFSICRHVLHVDGYMDAVGRVLTTDSELYGLSARLIERGQEIEAAIRTPVAGSTLVENWSREFGGLVEDLLGMDPKSRLAFYLIDTLCWFRDFTQGAVCQRIDCGLLYPEVVAQAVYVLQLQDEQRVLLVASKSTK